MQDDRYWRNTRAKRHPQIVAKLSGVLFGWQHRIYLQGFQGRIKVSGDLLLAFFSKNSINIRLDLVF
ncbi:MAG: hypothetical protein CRN43_21890, partial [Candidatus Nephrothrix sp. EaCA]